MSKDGICISCGCRCDCGGFDAGVLSATGGKAWFAGQENGIVKGRALERKEWEAKVAGLFQIIGPYVIERAHDDLKHDITAHFADEPKVNHSEQVGEK